ncbi:MAG: EAL domain-containing protein, partial [Deltaproteobacteria bacterium]|nr:EAL domain-containing protein [Deltaproteobacteria bacterium]
LLASNIIGIVVISILVLILTRFFGRRNILGPINVLVHAARHIGQGDFSVRVDIDHQASELGELAQNINAMTEDLIRWESEHERADRELKESEARIRALFNATTDSALLIDTDGSFLALNYVAAQRRGQGVEELIGKCLYDYLPAEAAQTRKAWVEEVIKAGKSVAFEEERDDRIYRLRLFPILDHDGKVVQLASFSRDITEMKKAESRLKYQAFHDELTGLANRAYLMDCLRRTISQALTEKCYDYALAFFDLDNFKLVNDSFGHVLGDNLLQLLSQRLTAGISPETVLARFGGDEFALLFTHAADNHTILKELDTIHQLIDAPFTVGLYEIRTSASIGVVFGRLDYTSPDQLIRDADIAMYQAKKIRTGGTIVFDRRMHEIIIKRLNLESKLRQAVSQGELSLVYQPIFSLPDLTMAGFEALVRWLHPDKGYIPPSVFIPVAEETGLIVPIGDFVLKEACKQMSQWLTRYPQAQHLVMNVNLSGKQFFQADPVEVVRKSLNEAQLRSKNLKVEITETTIMENVDLAVSIFNTLRELGIKIALDDFGTGYSSLGYLRSFPLDSIKIDRSFVVQLDQNEKDYEIVTLIVKLAHALGMDVTAEGIETDNIIDKIIKCECDYVQGYLLAQPMNAHHAEGMIRGYPIP